MNVQRGTSGTINLTLTGTDLQGLRRSDSLVVTYRSGARARASAGPDQTLYVPSGGATITLDGRGSLAARASLDEVSSSERLQYSWQQVASDFVDAPAVGSTSPAFVTLSNANTARPQFVAPPPAGATGVSRYFRLTVTDIVTGGRDSDVVAITANPARRMTAFLLNAGYAVASIRSTEGEVRFIYLTLGGGLAHPTTVSVNWTLGPPGAAGRAVAAADDFCPAAGRRSRSNAWPNNAYPGGTIEFPVGVDRLIVPFYACVDDVTEEDEYYDITLSSLNDPTGGSSFSGRGNRSSVVSGGGSRELLLAGQFISANNGRPVLSLIQPPGILGCERENPDWVVQLNEEQQNEVSAEWLMGITQFVNPNVPPAANALGRDFFDGTRPIQGETGSYTDPRVLAGTIAIPGGETTAAISVQYRDDGVTEENEYYAMLLQRPSTGVIFQPGYTSNIIGNLAGILSDADPVGIITPTPAVIVEPAALPANPRPEDLTYVRFPIVIDQARATTTPVLWEIGGDAIYQGDYVGVAGFGVVPASLQTGVVLLQSDIPVSATSVVVEFVLYPDNLNEPDETIILSLANRCRGRTSAGARVTYTIIDDDPINILLQGPQAPLAEGASATFTLSFADGTLPSTTLTVPWSLNPVAGTSLTVPWSARPVVATSATSVDFVNLPSLPLTGTATFAAGESVWQLDLRIGLDRMAEPFLQGFEFVIDTATVTGAFGEVGVVSGSAIVAAIAADPVPYILPIITSPTTVIEGLPVTPTVLFVLSDPSGPVTSNLTLRADYALDGTATLNSDYEIAGDTLQIQRRPNSPNGTVVFAPGTSLARIGFSPTDDEVNEAGENVLITLNSPHPSNEVQLLPSLPLRQASFTIQDNDTIVVTVVAQNPSVVEPSRSINSVTTATFVVGISGGTLQHRLRVSYTLNGTATPDVDYTCPPRTTCSGVGNLDFSPGPGGNMTATVALNILGDNIAEATENVFVSLTAARFDGVAGAVFLDNPARPSATTIRNDPSDIVFIEPLSQVAAESNESVLVRFTGVGGGGADAQVPNIDTTATVTYRLQGTAVMGVNYDTPPGYAGRRGTFTLPPGWPGVEAGVTIPLLHDGFNRATRTVMVILTEVAVDRSDVRLRLGDPARTAVLSIRDIDPILVSLVPPPPSAPRLLEGDVWQFDIQAGGGVPTADMQVDIAVVQTGIGDEADASDVVNGDSLTVTIPMDQRSARASIVLRSDSTREPNETLTVRLTGGRSAGEVRPSAVSQTTVSTVIQADGFVYGIFDFGHAANIVNIAEGAQANAAIRVFEPGASARVSLTLDVPYTIYPEFSDVPQGGSIADYSVGLPAGGAGPVGTTTSNDHGYTSEGVIGNTDFQRTNFNNTTLRIAAIDDFEVEGDERFRLELEDPINVRRTGFSPNIDPNTAVADVTRDDFYITILDNDRADIFMELVGDPDEFTEGTATVNVNFVVTGGSVASPFEGRYILEGCGENPATGQPYCTAGFQTISNSGVGRSSLTSIDIASGSTESKDTLIVSSNVPDNNWNEPDHTVVTVGWRHELASLPGSIRSRITLGNTTETVVLRDDDDITVDIAATRPRVDRGATVTFIVTLSGASSGSRGVITLPYEDASTVAREDITPDFSSADATVPGRLVIPPGETTGVIVLRLADNVAGSFSDLVVTLREPQVGPGGGRVALAAAASARVEVAPAVFRVDVATLDRDAAAAGTQVHEGSTATFVVTPEGDRPSGDTVIVWTIGGDVEPADYTPASGTLTFASASWGTSQTVQIGIADDTLNESTETLTLLLGNAVGGIGVEVAQSDPIAYATEDITVAEGATATVVVRLSGLSEGDVTVPFTVSGSATAGLDYTAITATAVTIAAGATTAAVSAPILRDNLNEASETIVLELGEAVVTTATGMVARATTSVAVVIADLNLLNAAITSRQDRVDEDNPVYFDVTLSGGMATAPVMVPFTLRGVADADDDYHIALPLGQCAADTTGTLTIAAGTTAGLVALWIAHEFVTEEDEMLSVTIGTPQTAGLAGVTAAMAGVVIPANDPPPQADAGVDQVVDLRDEVTLSATASVIVATDSNGTLEYLWQQVAADSTNADVIAADDERFVPLSGADSAVATFTAPAAPERAGRLYFRVTVTDNMTGNSDTDEVVITVRGPRPINISSTAENPASVVNEGTTMTFRIVLGDRSRVASDGTDRVDWAVAAVGDYPAEAGDFADAEGNALTDFPSGTAVIPADEFETRVDLWTWNDTALEGTETFVIRISDPFSQGSPVVLGMSSSLTGTIIDDEMPNFTIVAADATVAEGGVAVFTVTPIGDLSSLYPGAPFIVESIAVTGVDRDDFSVLPGTPLALAEGELEGELNFPGGDSSVEIRLGITDDNINEDAETLRLAFGEAGGGYSADVTIPRNDAIFLHVLGGREDWFTGQYGAGANLQGPVAGRGSCGSVDPTYELAEGTTATFSVVLGNEDGTVSYRSAADISAVWHLEQVSVGGRANSEAAPDFAFVGGGVGGISTQTSALTAAVTIPAGSTQADITFSILQDGITESNLPAYSGEIARLYLQSGSAEAGSGAGEVTLATDENCAAYLHIEARMLTVTGPDDIPEMDSNTTRSYTVVLTGTPFSDDTLVTWRLTTGTRIVEADAADFMATTGTVVFSSDDPGGASENFTVTVIGDNLNETTETFIVRATVPDPDADGGTRYFDERIAGEVSDDGVVLARRIGTVAVTIADDDPITATVTGGGDVSEGQSTTATVVLTGAELSAPATVDYAIGVDGDPATVDAAAADYTGSGSIEIAAGASSGTIAIQVLPDGLNEASEVFVVTVEAVSAVGVIHFVESTHTFTILDGDDITVSFADDAVSIEEGQTVELVVNLNKPSAAQLTVPYRVTAGGVNPPPFTDNTGSPLVFAAGATRTVISLTSDRSDTLNASTGTLTLTLDAGAIGADVGAGVVTAGGPAVATVTFREFLREFSVVADAADIVEGDRVVFAVTLAGLATRPSSVTWTISGDVDGADYTTPTAASGVLEFDGAGLQTIHVDTFDDALSETTETLTLSLSDVRSSDSDIGIGAAAASATVIIAASDPITVAIAADRARLVESGTATFTVTLDGGMPGAPLEVPFSVIGGVDADDYDIVLPGGLAAHTTMGILTIAVEETSGRIVLRVPDDNLAEGEETLTVVLDEPQTAGSIDIGTASATVTIEPSVRLPEVSLSGPGVVGVEGSSQVWVVQLDPAHSQAVEVEYRVAGTGGADSVVAGDFADAQGMTVTSLPLTGVVTIASGTTATAITLYYRNDDDESDGLVEGEERFEVSLTGFVGDPGVLFATTLDTVGPERSSGSIVNIAGVEAGVTASAESAAEGTSAVFTIALSEVQSQATTVHWMLGGDAQQGVDYTGDAIAVQPDAMRYRSVIAAGSTRTDVVFSLTDDMQNESSETLVMTIVLTGSVRPGRENASARYAILDNDAMVVNLSGPAVAVAEGATATFTMRLGRLPTRTLSVPWRVTGTSVVVSAEADDFADFDALPFAGTATFAAGATTTVVNIVIGSDRTVERDEQFFEFTVGAAAVTGAYGEVGVVGSPVMSSIAADAAAEVTLTALQESVDEAGVTSPTFLITLGDDAGPLLSGADVSLSYVLTGTAVSGEDYAGASTGSVLISGGSSGTRLVLALVNDVVNESTESITLSLGGAEATIHIGDDDVITGTVGAPSSALLEGATATFTVTIGGGSLSAGTILTIPWRITTSSSAADDDVAPADFGRDRAVFPSGSVSFVMGESEKATSAIEIVEDGLAETTETFVLVLGEPSGAAGVTSLRGVSASATIAASSESLFRFTAVLEDAGQAAVEEATTSVNIIVGVEASGGVQRSTLSVSYSLSGTATPGADYEVSATTGTVVFGVGETMRTIELGILPDIYAESTESIVLSLSEPVLGDNPGAVAVGASSSATVLIRPGQRLGISLQSPSQLTEDAASAVVSIEAVGMARFETTATVTYTLGGTADAGVDYSVPQGYANSSGTVTLPPDWPNTSSPGLSITPLDDGDNESTETIVVTISEVAIEGGYWRIVTGSVVLRLVDDDALTVSLQGPDSAAAEGGNADFTVVLSGSTPTADVVVDYEIVPGGGIEASDIDGALTGVITIVFGSMSEEIAIPIADDTVPESTETLTVMLTAGRSAGVVEVSQAAAAVDVERSDVAGIEVIAATTTRTEGQSAVFDLQFVSAGGAALSLGEIDGATSALVSWTLGGAATAGADYPGADSGATQVPFNTTASVTVALTDDEVNESAETVVLTVNDVSVNGASVDYLELSASSGSATVAVADNDDAMVSVERAGADTSPVNEGDEVMFHINLDVESQGDVEVPFTIGGVTTQDYALAVTMFPVTLSPGSSRGTVTLVGGSTRATIALTVLPDGMAETTETLVVSLQPPQPGPGAGRVTLGAAATAEVAIRENAATTLFYEIDAVDAVVAEGATATFDIALVNEVDGEVNTATVMYSITGTVEREDYAAATTGTLTFTPSDWQTTQRVVIPLLSDNLNESSETLTLQLSSPSGGAQEAPALRGAGRASVMIAESDPITYSIEGPDRVVEGEAAMFTVILSGAVGGSEGAVTVPYTIAADAGDYAGPLSGAETLAVGTTSTVITAMTVEDAVNESTGTLVVTLGAASKDAAAGAVSQGTPSAVTAMIVDNDALTVSVSPSATTAPEGTDVVLDVILSGAASGSAASIEVPYSVNAAPAAGITTDDYATTPTSPLTITAGATTGTITVSIEYDGMEEDAETLTVVLGNPIASAGGGAVALGTSVRADITIPENSTSVRVLTITGAGVVAEGDAEVSVEYTMGLDGAGFTEARDVAWEVVHGTTTATDFTGATSGMVSLGPSAATASFTVGIAGDSLNEATETFSIEASVEDSVSDGGTDSGDPFAVSVTDDDELTVGVSADTAGVSEGATASFTLTLDGGTPTADVEVSFTLDGSAVGADYTAAASPLTIAAGTTSGELMLPIRADDLNESTETLTVELTGAVNMPSAGSIVLGTTRTEVSIAQSDAAEVVLARSSGEEAPEGGTAQFVLRLDTPSADVVTVTWMASVITQTNTGTGDRGPNEADNSDFRAVGDVSAVITSGAIVGTTVVEIGDDESTFSIGIAQDRREEDAESVVIRIIGVSAGMGAGEVSASPNVANLTIPANLAATRFLSVRANQETIEEGMDAEFTVVLSGVDDPTADVTVDWSVVGGGANPAEADDYTAMTGSLSFSGFGSRSVSVSILDDGLNESAETLMVMLENAAGGGNPSAVISTDRAVVVVGQSDPITYSIESPGQVVEGEDAMFTVILSGAVSGSEGSVTVPVMPPGGTASGADHAALPATVTVSTNTTTVQLTVALTDDMLNESTETLTVTLGAANEAGFMKDAAAGAVTRGTPSAATAMIEDNDALTVSVSPPATTAPEGMDVVLDVILSGAASGSAASIEVPYSVNAAPAAGITTDDYTTTPTSPLTIAAGATTGTITVSIEYDGMEEDAETLTVVLGNPIASAGGGAVALGTSVRADVTIPENSTSVRVLTITGTGVVTEGDAEVSVEYTMGLMGAGFAEARSVMWEIVHGTTTATDFFGATSGMVSLGPSAATASFTVGIAGDSLNEATERFSIEASVEDSVSDGGTDSGDPFEVSITDDDELVVTVSADTGEVSEGATASFTVTLSEGTPTADVEVSFMLRGSAVGGAADAGGDYAIVASPLVIAPGTTIGEVMLPIHADNLNESTETLALTLDSAATSAGLTSLGASTMAEVIIRQSDAAEVVLARSSGEEASEGGTAEFVLRLDTPSADVVTVTWMASVITQTNTGTGDRAPNSIADSDFRAVGDAVITSGAIVGTTVVEMGNVTSIFSIGIAQDSREEDAESVVIRIIGVSAGMGAGEVSASPSVANLTIPANLAATRFLSVRADQAEVSEGEVAQFTVELSGEDEDAPTADVTVDWSVAGGGANPAEADDYTATTGSLTFSGFGSRSVSVTIRDDGLNESAETLVVMLTNARGGGNPSAAISIGSAEVVVRQSDPITYSIEGPDQVTEGEDAMFTVILSGAVSGSEGAVTVPVTAPGGTASDADHAALPATVTVSTNTTTVQLTVALTDDLLNESAETLTVTLGAASDAGFMKNAAAGAVSRGTPSAATAMIVDNDALTVSVSPPAPTAPEGTDVVLDVVLSGAASGSAASINVPYSVLAAAGITADDYAIAPTSPLTITTGTTAGTITVSIGYDGMAEDAETLTVILGEPEAGAVGGEVALGTADSASITIPENTTAARTLTIAASLDFAEGDGPYNTLEISMGAADRLFEGETVIAWRISGTGDGATPADLSSTGNVTFVAGSRTGSVSEITVVDDMLNEATESFIFSLQDLMSDGGSAFEAVAVTITDNDPVTATLSGAGAVAEGATATVAVVLSGGEHTQPVTLDYVIEPSGSSDYADAGNGRITIAVGETGGAITVVTVADTLNEATESFNVSVSDDAARSAGVVRAAGSPQTFMITDNDPTTVTLISPESGFAEGRQPTFDVLLEGGELTESLSLDWSISTGSVSPSASPEDFVNPPDAGFPITGTQSVSGENVCPGRRCSVAARQIARDDDDRVESFTFGLTAATGGGGSGAGVGTLSEVSATILRTDTVAPELENGLYAAGRNQVWFEADEDLAILLPSQATAEGVVLRPEVSGLEGFSVEVRSGPGSGTVVVSNARYIEPKFIVLELERNLTEADGASVYMSYQYPGAGDGIFDRAIEEGLADASIGRNQMLSQTNKTAMRSIVTRDADGDGLADVAEIRAGENPLSSVLPGRLPAFAIRPDRRVSPVRIAWSGIREHGVRAHLGVSSVSGTTQTAASSVQAYYLSETFGYDGGYDAGVAGYGCLGRFPADYALPVRAGGCEIVDWNNVSASTDHRVGWLATAANGLWAVDLSTVSRLPEQVIRRIPELNMASERLFTTGIAVTVLAQTDDDGESFTTRTSVPGVWTIEELPGVSGRLWQPSTMTFPAANELSLGLSTQTSVLSAPAAAEIPPVLGLPVLTSGGQAVNVLERGATYTLRVEAKVGGETMTVEREIMIPATAEGATTEVRVEVPGVGGVSATFNYPLVDAGTPLARALIDTDRDGIADAFDDYDEVAHLPVEVSGTAGAGVWHHIRPVQRQHGLRVGDTALMQAAAGAAEGDVRYRDYAASSRENLPSSLPVVYDFSIHDVDYAEVTTAGVVGGTAGVIIPLPASLRGEDLNLVKYDPATGAVREFDTQDGSRYGFARLLDGVCPDDIGERYRPGPGSGDCMVVYIEDGGANDDDGVVNGVIRDPLSPTTTRFAPGGVRGGGGGGSISWTGLIALLLLLSVLQIRRRHCRRYHPGFL